MKTSKIKLLIWLGLSFNLCSCVLPDGVSIGTLGEKKKNLSH